MRVVRPGAMLVDENRLLLQPRVEILGHRIVAIQEGARVSAAEEDHGDSLWLAAPLMLHAHLESFDAPSAAWPRDSFANWVRALLEWRQGTRLSAAESGLASLQEMTQAGCGLVVASESEAAPPMAPFSGTESLLLPEIFSPEPDVSEQWRTGLDCSAEGVALHAPWSVHPAVAQNVFSRSPRVSIHLGEHAEEREFLSQSAGPLRDLFEERGRALPQAQWDSPVAWLAEMGGLRAGTWVVHGGDLTAPELQHLETSGVAVVWCPGTHQYFSRSATCFAEGLQQSPLLGCDSRASNSSLDPLREFQLACSMEPHWSPQSWWASATRRAAQAVGRKDLGVLDLGRRLRVLRLPIAFAEDSAQQLLSRLAHEPLPASDPSRFYEAEA